MHYAPLEKKIWSHVGLAFAIAYKVLVSLVYSVQLITVVPLIFQGEAHTVAFLVNAVADSGFQNVINVTPGPGENSTSVTCLEYCPQFMLLAMT